MCTCIDQGQEFIISHKVVAKAADRARERGKGSHALNNSCLHQRLTGFFFTRWPWVSSSADGQHWSSGASAADILLQEFGDYKKTGRY